MLEAAVRALGEPPDVVLVDAGGADHPRGGGLALHLGCVLGIPSIGVTNRPLVATGAPPGPCRGDAAPLTLHGREVARRLTTRPGARPVVVHAGWRTDLDTAVAIVLAVTPGRRRTPEPLRAARTLARGARARAGA